MQEFGSGLKFSKGAYSGKYGRIQNPTWIEFATSHRHMYVSYIITCTHIIQVEPERAQNTRETGSGFICIYIYICMFVG